MVHTLTKWQTFNYMYVSLTLVFWIHDRSLHVDIRYINFTRSTSYLLYIFQFNIWVNCHLSYTANFATYKIHMKFIYITYEKYVISTHESYTREFHMNVHACNMYEFCIYFIYIKLHIKYICTIYVNFIYITYIFHTFTKYICITYEFFHAYYIYKI